MTQLCQKCGAKLQKSELMSERQTVGDTCVSCILKTPAPMTPPNSPKISDGSMDDRTARERAVEEAREELTLREVEWYKATDNTSLLVCAAAIDTARESLILAARLAERARVREAVERCEHRYILSNAEFNGGVASALAAIDALPETPGT